VKVSDFLNFLKRQRGLINQHFSINRKASSLTQPG